MNLNDLRDRVRVMTRDLQNKVFGELTLRMYFDEGINRLKQVIPELDGMEYLRASEEKPKLLPEKYHYLIALYCASRCFSQDERHYQAIELMNEFEIKLDELNNKVINAEIEIADEDGNVLSRTYKEETVVLDYYY